LRANFVNGDNPWATSSYPDTYQKDVNRSIGFSGLGMDMFASGKVSDMFDIIEKWSEAPANKLACLDIGCGIGLSHPLISPFVAGLCGSDVSEEAISIARSSNSGVEYRVQNGPNLPFDSEMFDFSSTVCVMHHVPTNDWPAFVAEAFRVTRPGGLFAVYEHNPINPMTRWAVWRCPFDHGAVLLRAGRVMRMLVEQGFEIVTRRYLFFVPIDRPWARRLDRLLRWFPLGAQYVVCARRPVSGVSASVQDPA
jgi:SAM-dependent methyltransferase